MTLSSGTLNLKFMQRAAARQQQSPATPQTSTPSSTRAPAASSIPTPSRDLKPSIQAGRFDVLNNAEAGPSTPAPITTELNLTPAEKEARWSIPRRATPRDESITSRSSWEFESGYMSFLLPAEVRSEGSGGGGRMAFGGFGKRDEEETIGDQADEDGHEPNGDAQNLSEEVKPRKRRRPTDASPGPPTLASSSRTFVKPEGFDDRPSRPTTSTDTKTQRHANANQPETAAAPSSDSPSPSTGSGSSERRKKRKGAPGQQLKVSQADRLRATISNARKANGSGSSTPTSSSLPFQVGEVPLSTTTQPIDLTGSPSPPPATPDETSDRPNQRRKKKRKNKDRESILDTATPTALASGTSSPIKSPKTTPRGGSPNSPSASTLDQKQAQMKADKRRRRRERKKLKQETGLKIEGDEMS